MGTYYNMFREALLLAFFGITVLEARPSYIIGGEEAAVGEFPWQGSLQIFLRGSYRHICGCSLISPRFAVTAAHCIKLGYKMVAAFGINKQSDINTNYYKIYQATVHENWRKDPYSLEWDIAVIEFNEDVQFNNNIQPIKLATKDTNIYGEQEAIISGWGVMGVVNGNPLPIPNVLQKSVHHKIKAAEYCHKFYGRHFKANSEVCIKADEQSACFGDSGGPLVVKEEDTYVLIGITSWVGNKSCDPSLPQVYTKVAYYRNWIKSKSNI